MFQKIALAIAFSPRLEALLFEVKRLKGLFDSELVLIHIGEKSEKEETILKELLQKLEINESKVTMIWEKGDPAKEIIRICKKEKVTLLVAGALKTEDLITHYIGSIARKIIRKAECSVLMLVDPSTDPKPFKKIVIEGEHAKDPLIAMGVGCKIAKAEEATQVHVLREIKMLGLNMAIAGESTEEEYSETKRNLVNEELKKAEELLSCLDASNLKVNVKVFSGKTGYEIAKFAEKAEADLLIVNAPTHKLNIFDRFFAHDLEYIMSDLPCNLLLVHH